MSLLWKAAHENFKDPGRCVARYLALLHPDFATHPLPHSQFSLNRLLPHPHRFSPSWLLCCCKEQSRIFPLSWKGLWLQLQEVFFCTRWRWTAEDFPSVHFQAESLDATNSCAVLNNLKHLFLLLKPYLVRTVVHLIPVSSFAYVLSPKVDRV